MAGLLTKRMKIFGYKIQLLWFSHKCNIWVFGMDLNPHEFEFRWNISTQPISYCRCIAFKISGRSLCVYVCVSVWMCSFRYSHNIGIRAMVNATGKWTKERRNSNNIKKMSAIKGYTVHTEAWLTILNYIGTSRQWYLLCLCERA